MTDGFSSFAVGAGKAFTVVAREMDGAKQEVCLALDAWIAAAGLRTGSASRVLYLQFGAESELRVPAPFVVDRSADLLTELQVPIDGPST